MFTLRDLGDEKEAAKETERAAREVAGEGGSVVPGSDEEEFRESMWSTLSNTIVRGNKRRPGS